MIPDSTELWTEYIKLELGWVEALRRRWNVLGIHDELDVQGNGGVEAESLTGGEGSFGPDGEDARKAILAGKLVLQAINSALDAITVLEQGLNFRLGLVDMLRRYPSALRGKCLDAMFADLQSVEQDAGLDAQIKAEARLATTTRRLYETRYVAGEDYSGLSGVELVEELGKVGKEIRRGAKGDAAFCDVGGRWLASQVQLHQDNEELVSRRSPLARADASAHTYCPSLRPSLRQSTSRRHHFCSCIFASFSNLARKRSTPQQLAATQHCTHLMRPCNAPDWNRTFRPARQTRERHSRPLSKPYPPSRLVMKRTISAGYGSPGLHSKSRMLDRRPSWTRRGPTSSPSRLA